MRALQREMERAAPETMRGMRALYCRFTALYSDTSETLNHYVSSITRARDAIGNVYHDAATFILGDKKQKFESFSKSVVENAAKEAQKRADRSVEFLRQNYRFIIDSKSAQALSVLIASASIGALVFLPGKDLIPCITTIGFMLGTAGLAVTLGRSLDLGEERNKTRDMLLKMSHEVAKSICAMVIQAKLAVLFTAMVSASIVASPLTCAVAGSILASVATAAIISAIVYGEKLILPRDIRNILFTSPKDELTKLLKSKQDYIREVGKNLTEKQLEYIKQESQEISKEINLLDNLERQVDHFEKALQKKDLSAKDRKNLEKDLAKAKRNLHVTEQKYLRRYHSRSIISKILPKSIARLISNYCSGFFIKLIIHQSIKALLKENLRITPSKMYNIIKVKLLETFITCGDMVKNIASYLTPEQHEGAKDVVDIILNDKDLLDAATSMVVNPIEDKIVDPMKSYVAEQIYDAEVFVSSTILARNSKATQSAEPKVTVSGTAEHVIDNVERFAIPHTPHTVTK